MSTQFQPGIQHGLLNEDYHRIEALSASGIRKILQSPAHYRHAMNSGDGSITISKEMGSALHLGVLEPDRFDSGVLTIPDDAPNRPSSRTMKAAKPSPASIDAMKYWADFDAMSEGRIVLSTPQFEVVRQMVHSARAHPSYPLLFSDGAAEVTYQWIDPEFQIPCRCRFDYLRTDGLAVDLKSTRDASHTGFSRAAENYGYDMQEAHYSAGYRALNNGADISGFIFVAVENVAPYNCAIYVMPEDVRADAIERVSRAKAIYAECLETRQWPGYPTTVQTLKMRRRYAV